MGSVITFYPNISNGGEMWYFYNIGVYYTYD